MKFFSIVLVLLFSVNAYAGIVLEMITQEELDAVHKDLSGLMLFTTISPGTPIADGFGVEIGAVGGIGSMDNINELSEESSEEESFIPILPNLFFVAGISLPGSVTISGNWRPRFSIFGFESTYYGGGIRWTFSNLFLMKPWNLDIGMNYSQGDASYDQTIGSIESHVKLERRIIAGGGTIGLEFAWFRPYVYIGYAKSMLDISATNAASVFDPNLSNTDTAESNVDTIVGRIGFDIQFQMGNMGVEYQHAFGNYRVMVKTSSRFP